MLTFTQGNLLDAETEALVNTVNTEGVMGKGIALMFKEAFPENFRAYAEACKHGEVQVGRMFVTERRELLGPRWIINFPTKQHWRYPSKIEWIDSGLAHLKRVIAEKKIRSIALPPLEATTRLIDGFESPLGMELLATVDWLLHELDVAPRVDALREGLRTWPGGTDAAKRKLRLFDERLIKLALDRLAEAA